MPRRMSLLGNIPPEEFQPARDDREIDLADLPRCPNCGYIIYKVGKMRCPECGVPISHEDLRPSQVRLAVEEQVRDERRIRRIAYGLLLVGIVLCGLATWKLYPITMCTIGPLLFASVLALVWCSFTDGAMHRVLLYLGVLWLICGGILASWAFL